MKNRLKCIVKGCNNPATQNNKRKDGSYNYRKLCATHHKKKYNMPLVSSSLRRKYGETLKMDRSICILCGWNKAPCDRHRIKYGSNGGIYTLGNTLSVCPNCHRLIHAGLLQIK